MSVPGVRFSSASNSWAAQGQYKEGADDLESAARNDDDSGMDCAAAPNGKHRLSGTSSFLGNRRRPSTWDASCQSHEPTPAMGNHDLVFVAVIACHPPQEAVLRTPW